MENCHVEGRVKATLRCAPRPVLVMTGGGRSGGRRAGVGDAASGYGEGPEAAEDAGGTSEEACTRRTAHVERTTCPRVPLDETFEWAGIANDTNYPIRVMNFPHVPGINTSTLHVGEGAFPDKQRYAGGDAPIPWLSSTYDNLTPFSAICYYFGRALHKRMAAEGDAVPLGLVSDHWGGSLIESWVPETNAATNEIYCTDRNSRVGRTPGQLFNTMIMPVSNATIKGWVSTWRCPDPYDFCL